MDSVPPAIILLIAAVAIPFLPASVRPWAFLAAPVIVLVQLLAWLEPGDTAALSWLDLELLPMEVTELNEVWATIFVLVGIGGGAFALHLRDRGQQAAALAYLGSALGVVLAGDLLTLIVFWEAMAITSMYLVVSGGRPHSRGAAMRYLFVHIVGGSLLLGGILWQIGDTGSFAIVGFEQNAAGWLMFAGIAVNAAVVPVHAWLSDAYPESSATGMVFLAAFTTKTAVYLFMRGFAGWDVLLVLGPVMALYGALFALIQNDIRRLLAYHIISQVGFMVTAVGVGTALALESAADQAFTHVLWQAVMVMAAGAVLQATGTTKLTELGGLARPLRGVLVLFMVGAVAIALFPLLGGLAAEELYTEQATGVGRRWAALLLYAASAGTVLAVVVKLPYYAFFGEHRGAIITASVPWGMYAGMGAAAVLAVVMGFAPAATFEALQLHLAPPGYTTENVVFGLEVLAFALIGGWLALPLLEPRDTVTLDTDWLYRKAGTPVRLLIQQPLELPFALSQRAVDWTVRTATRFVTTPEQGWATVLGWWRVGRRDGPETAVSLLGRPPLGVAVAGIVVLFAVIVLLAQAA
jgi:multicomponent Na+:H+ antiporter subunit D